MRLGGLARYLTEVKTEKEIEEAHKWAMGQNLPVIMVGDGSNIVWRDEGFPGLVIINSILGRDVLSEDDKSVVIKIGAGENWDGAVARTVENSWSGIEFLSKIPGRAGAAPVQNIGAYGAEIADTLIGVGLYDSHEKCFETLMPQSCGFGYRTSRFKTTDRGRFFITSITLRLNKTNPAPPFYESLSNYFKENGITDFTPAVVRDAVTAIRKIRLPDPSVVANNGSFFTNPFVNQTKYEELKARYPDIKGWPSPDGRVKLSAGWLVEKAGFKDIHDDPTGMATWHGNALVMVNEHARKTADLLEFRQKIIFKVDEMFGIVLEQEPELLP